MLDDPKRTTVCVDLTGVTYIDAAGKARLAQMHEQGAKFIAGDCATKALVAEIVGEAERRSDSVNWPGQATPQRLPKVPGLDLAVHFAEVEEPGGDFYEVSPLGPASWAIVVADVSGHGLATAVVLALTHALGHALQEQGTPPSPGAALTLVNGALAARDLVNSGQFVTAFAGWYESRTQVLKYASAGHPPPRLIRDNDVRRLDAACGIPLGVAGESFYQEAIVQLQPTDRLVLFTDGITECANAAGELFGDQRLDEALRAPTSGAAKLLERVVHSVHSFRAGLPPVDDETCLVACVKQI